MRRWLWLWWLACTQVVAPHHRTPPTPHTSEVGVAVWSGGRGWGLQVESCPQQPHKSNSRCGGEVRTEVLSEERWTQPQVSTTTSSPPDPATTTTTTPPQPGITLSILDQRRASTIFHKVFPLGQYWAHWADLEWHLSRVAAGRIVVMTVAVSGTVGLRHAAHQLAQLGSLFALHLTPLAHWTWVFVKGGRTISETAVIQDHAPHHAHLILPLSLLPTPSDNNSYLQHQRWQYCAAHGAMGGLCDEYSPDPLPGPTAGPVVHQAALAGVPVVVTAGNRYQYLYHTLTTLLAAPGAQHDNLLVVLGDAPPATTQLLRLINVNFTTLPVHGRDNNKLFRYYRSVFHLVAHTFPDAPAVILLDEDVQVSPDFFSFMSQTLWLLHADPTLYCINAYSATGFNGIAHDPHTVLRARVQVEWGYALSLEFVNEVVRIWPKVASEGDTLFYDEWLYKHGSGGRECVFPEVTRTLHYGIGVNSDAWSTEAYFQSKPLVRRPHVPLEDVGRLLLPQWKEHFSSSIRDATPLTGNPCRRNFVPPVRAATNFVFFYSMRKKPDGEPDYKNFYFAAKCLNAWGVSEQGLHERVLTVRVSLLATVYLVGAPHSPYAHLRPRGITPWDYDSVTDQDEDIIIERIKQLEIGNYRIVNINVTSDYLMEILSLKSS
ncbi:protein O-linked-mannose beta-1,2-N-acetylglucosaminyltransferase 1-like isoform X3 [Panulirus ornatus]|uniref:protein O-linked-mannose beta-1,2-N-acetylglucosaminyltransferase 1-like isoform X3 n=1 Tax=Panulirus ornatus TaxID=150431 RepID=UPI003A8725DE